MIIIDVRSKDEFEQAHLQEAVNIPVENFIRGSIPVELKRVDKNEHIVLYCQSGNRADMVRSTLIRHGFTNVENCTNMQQAEIRLKRY